MYSFDYQRPGDRAAAAAAAKSSDARYLAGGQTLIQAMKLRLSSSERLVDLGAIADLKGIKVDGSSVTIGATTTHATVARSAEVQKAIPALAELAGGIGDQMVRNVGTHRRLDRQRRPGRLLPGRRAGPGCHGEHRPAKHRGRQLLHWHVRNRAAAG